jgi:hypothetical protein
LDSPPVRRVARDRRLLRVERPLELRRLRRRWGRGCSCVLVFTASSRFTAHLVLASPRHRLAVVRGRRHRQLLRHDLPVILGRPVPGRLCVPRRRDLWTCATRPSRRPRDRARRGARHGRREHVRADSLAGAAGLPGWLAHLRGGHLMRLPDSRPPAARAALARIAQPLSAHARLSAVDAGDVGDAHQISSTPGCLRTARTRRPHG